MGETLIILGLISGVVAILIIYGVMIAGTIFADYWWQKLLGILAIIILPIILMVVGAMIC